MGRSRDPEFIATYITLAREFEIPWDPQPISRDLKNELLKNTDVRYTTRRRSMSNKVSRYLILFNET